MVAYSYANLSKWTCGSGTSIDYDIWNSGTAGTDRYQYTTAAIPCKYYTPGYYSNLSEWTGYHNSTITGGATEYNTLLSSYISYPHVWGNVWRNTPTEVFKEKLRSNLIINVKSRSDATQYPEETEPERKALETLREVVTEAEFRKYLRYGFVLVKGESGKTYQVFKNKSHCRVWLNGKLIEEVCVRIKDKEVPLTDNVIAFKTMIEASEVDFKKLGNVYKMAV